MSRTLNEKVSMLGKQFSDSTIAMHEAIARHAGLAGTDHKYLNVLMKSGPMTAGELAKLTGLTTGAVTGLIDRFEKKKLVKRTFDKQDRRKVILVPNEKNAGKLLAPPFAALKERIMSIVSSMPKKDVAVVERYLHAAIAAMDAVTDNLKSK